MKRKTFGGPASSLLESNLCPVLLDHAVKSGLEAGSVASTSRTWPTPTSLIALLALTTGSGQRSPLVSSVLATASGIASLPCSAPARAADAAKQDGRFVLKLGEMSREDLR